MSKRNDIKRVALAALVLALMLVVIYSGLRILESTVLYSAPVQTEAPRKTIERDGVAYFPRQDITTILVMGVDDEGPVADSGSYRNTGEVDMVALVILDHAQRTYNVLCLNRDTMVTMPALGLGGRQAGNFYGQLALSHTYGSGLEDSAENVRTTVSGFLNNITIDYYVAMNMDAIPILNDAVGGVTVDVQDDFSAVDPAITRGQFTLRGQQAQVFVQTRNIGNKLNLSRMGRQEQYMRGLAHAMTVNIRQSDTFMAETYEALTDYLVTDCSVNVISGLLQRYSDYAMEKTISVEGENVLGEEYYEFYPDEEKLNELILQLFYAPKE